MPEKQLDFLLNVGAKGFFFPHPSNKREPINARGPMATDYTFKRWLVDKEIAPPHDLRRTVATGLGGSAELSLANTDFMKARDSTRVPSTENCSFDRNRLTFRTWRDGTEKGRGHDQFAERIMRYG